MIWGKRLIDDADEICPLTLSLVVRLVSVGDEQIGKRAIDEQQHRHAQIGDRLDECAGNGADSGFARDGVALTG